MNATEERAARIEEKFDFFFIGLVFTTLAASIQTASFGAMWVADAAELIAWVFLLVSAVSGLYRLEQIPGFLYQQGRSEEMAENLTEARRLKHEGQDSIATGLYPDQPEPIDHYIERTERHMVDMNNRSMGDFMVSRMKYAAYRPAFVIGLIGLVIARGIGPALALMERAI